MSALISEPAAEPGLADRTPGRRGGFFIGLLCERKAAAIGLGLILFFVVLAIIAPLISPYSPTAQTCGAARPPCTRRSPVSTGSAAMTAASTCSAS